MTLPAVLREAAAEPRGALVLLHGRGTDQHDLAPLLDALDPRRELIGIAPGAPLTDVPPGGRHWYRVERVGFPDHDTFHAAYRELCDFLDDRLASAGVEWGRTVIGGFSMGAVMSYAVALGEDRPRPAGVLAMSGFVPTVEGWEPHLEGRAGLRVLIHHGSRDPVIPVELGRRAAELLERGGLAVTYLESEAGHSVPPDLIPRAATFVAGAIGDGRPGIGERPPL
jgi:phospholipase/carboxylesterase